MNRLKDYRKDLFLILGILIGAGLLAGAFALAKKPGAYVRVEQNGKLLAVYSLAEDRREVFAAESGEAEQTADGEAGNVLVIENGAVHMESASCPDKLCVKQGTKSKVGETIVCLPHRLVVTVISAEEAEGLLP
ncbi:MAG: NusG domain II-containing protein [Lachnospiraceae bacterium]|nr:NusG domain II-containing protein [Lachnospiraceae bacterium]MBQ6196985.1 NusG domain II-containing protein [Lachnospiraceae bacterium]